jgi:hypothetical protein
MKYCDFVKPIENEKTMKSSPTQKSQTETSHSNTEKVFMKIFFFLPFIFNFEVAMAQIPFEAPSSVSPIPTDCKKLKLNGSQFMQKLHTIIANGDLTDIRFIEKTLGTKLNLTYGDTTQGTTDINHLIYSTDKLFDNPIHVDLSEWKTKTDQIKHNEIAFMRLRVPETLPLQMNFIKLCFRLSPLDFTKFFGGSWVRVPFTDGSDDFSFHQIDGSYGKNNSKIYLLNSLSGGENLVTDIAIEQKPKSVNQ